MAPELSDFDSLLSFCGWILDGVSLDAMCLQFPYPEVIIGTENSSGVEHLTSEPDIDKAVDLDSTNS